MVRSGTRAAELVSFEDAVVSFFVDAADMLGVPKSVAAIYGICFASPEPLSFSDINDRLDISSGSISQGLRVLKEVGALKIANGGRAVEQKNGGSDEQSDGDSGAEKASADGISESQLVSISASQRATAHYEPDLELRNLVLRWIEKRLQGQLSAGRSRLQQIIASIPTDRNAGHETLQTRFESLQTWHDKAHSLLPIVKTFLKLT